MATNRAAYKLVDSYDSEILNHMITGVITANQYGNALAAGNLIDVGFDTAEITPMQVLNRLKRTMDLNNVPDDGERFFIADPYFWELAGDENSKLMSHDYVSSSENLLRNGRVSEGLIRGFKCHTTNNMVTGSVGGTTYYTALAGHKSAVATASQIAQVEGFRSQNTFADVVRGLHLYGRKILRTEGLAACFFKID